MQNKYITFMYAFIYLLVLYASAMVYRMVISHGFDWFWTFWQRELRIEKSTAYLRFIFKEFIEIAILLYWNVMQLAI